MDQVWNFSVLGSKRTIVFGLVFDSLYQRAPFVTTMPYGSDRGPLGHCHSLTSPVAGSRRPRYPRTKSVYHTMWSPAIPTRRGRAPGSRRVKSRICKVRGPIVPTLF